MHIFRRRVNYHETDKMAITHHANYVKFMEEARIAFLDAVGLPFKKIEDRGFLSPVVEINVEYKHTSTFDDFIIVETSMTSYTGASFEFKYVMKNEKSGAIVAKAYSRHCFSIDGKVCSLSHKAPDLDEAMKAILEK